MGRLIFYYTNHGNADTPNCKWNDRELSNNPYTKILETEGYFSIIDKLLLRGVIDKAIVFIESYRSPGRFSTSNPNIQGYVVPHIAQSEKYIEPGDIIWARGGFRTWHDFLIRMQNKGHWCMLYAANTGRERWPFWDIILDDLSKEEVFDQRGRLKLFFKKPMNEKIFAPMTMAKKYDLCIGASHIHDKKAQYKMIVLLNHYKNITGKTFKCVMPGDIRRGTWTNKWTHPRILKSLNIEATGMLTRKELSYVLNQSKVFCYLGGSGQGDRGPMESLICGTPLFLGPTNRLAPVTYNNPEVSRVCSDPRNLDVLIKELCDFLNYVENSDNIKLISHMHFMEENGMDKTISDFARIINFLQFNERSKERLELFAKSRNAKIIRNI